jgi:hypothetical protein
MVDRRLSLADTLSTAFYFSECNPQAPASPEIRNSQLESAERAAASIDVRQAIPYSMPRSIYAMAALTLVAASLFGLRYGLTRSLDLHPPLVRLLQQAFGSPERTEEARNMRKTPRPEPASPDDNQSAMQEDDQKNDAQDANQSDDSSDAGATAEAAKDDNNKGEENAGKEGDQAEEAEGEDQNGPGEDSGNSDAAKNGQSGENQGDSKQDGKPDANQSSQNSSLMDKLKDFAQNLMSKVKQPSGGQQQSGEQNSKQGKGQQSAAKQQQAKDGQKQAGQPGGDPQEGQPGDQAENSQDPEGKGTGKNDSKQASKQPGSGVGSQDGEKRIRQAEQLAAMGKLSEIIGKRAATVTGEATLEVKSTSQQIRTPYAQRGAQHSQGGAEINRDEVPVGLESFVEQYFEQVRKQAPPAKK